MVSLFRWHIPAVNFNNLYYYVKGQWYPEGFHAKSMVLKRFTRNRDMKNSILEKCCSTQNWAKSVVLSMAVMEKRLSAQLCSRVLK